MKSLVVAANFEEMLKKYLTYPCFDEGILIPSNPYRRPLRKKDIEKIDFNSPITISGIFTSKNLILNKILLTVYEQDLLFSDSSFIDEKLYSDFKMFYDPEFVALGKSLRPTLEYLVFNFLYSEIEIIGNWNKSKLKEYLENILDEKDGGECALSTEILASDDPELATKMLLIQMAPDFLSEASAMARALPGSFGEIQSELMKVFIDEYGYGVHDTKHSTLFEKTLTSVGLNKAVHFYYNDYLPTSLMLTNYFHYIGSNKSYWFKYLGALYYVEATVPASYKKISALLKKVLKGIDANYFDEHVHIDKHHRRMVLEKIIYPSIDLHGDKVIDEILLGFESFRFVMKLADEDFMAQVDFSLGLKKQKTIEHAHNFQGDVSTGHINSEDKYLIVSEGELSLYTNGLNSLNLKKGDGIFIPKARLYSIITISADAKYELHSNMKAVEAYA